MEDFEEFSQSQKLTTQIRAILRNYPDGSQILKELIQNADDSKATSVAFVLSTKGYSTEKLFSPLLAPFQGAALYSYNNSVFTENDFENIKKINDSSKISDFQKNRKVWTWLLFNIPHNRRALFCHGIESRNI